jgi:hypothetical protein
METTLKTNHGPYDESTQQTLTKIGALLRNIKYGYIQVTIQGGRVVQIDKTEKFRVNGQKSKSKKKTDKQ